MYFPEQDSYFLSNILKKELESNKNLTFLDMGCGSCIQAKTAKKLGIKNIMCVDIDKDAIKQAKKSGFKAINSNLFKKVKGKFDIIVFNPPYLPQHKYDKQKDTSGGKLGDETILAFLHQAKKHLNQNGKIFLLFSSLTPKTRINKIINPRYKFFRSIVTPQSDSFIFWQMLCFMCLHSP